MSARTWRMGLSVLLLGLVVAAPPGPIAAQGSLLDQAKDLLEKALPGSGGLGRSEIAAGLKEALRVGTERVVRHVGDIDGFNGDPAIHIPLPGALKDVQSILRRVGMAALADDLELRLNRAAEAAAPEAKELFWQAIAQMTLQDVKRIYKGPDDAATRYFQGKMSPPLAARMAPIIDATLADVGALRAYDDMMSQYRAIPFVPDVKADLTRYVVDQAMAGIFHYVALEEAAIRHDPAKRTTALLRRDFGSG